MLEHKENIRNNLKIKEKAENPPKALTVPGASRFIKVDIHQDADVSAINDRTMSQNPTSSGHRGAPDDTQHWFTMANSLSVGLFEKSASFATK